MLTADLALARKKGDELVVRQLDVRGRREATEVAGALIEAARAHVGRRRGDLDQAWDEIVHAASQPKVAAGLRKLAEDACRFDAESTLSPADVRRELFTRASALRREGAIAEREAVLALTARALDVTSADLELALFADLRAEHVLRAAPPRSASELVAAYELGQAQAVLLRAVRVVCDVRASSPGVLRAFFAKLKFQRLLFAAERTGEGAFRITVDGPYSMFDAVTRYGVRFALLLPALRELDDWDLAAEVLWGKAKERLLFRLRSRSLPPEGPSPGERALLSDDAQALLEGIQALGSSWRAEPATALLDLPGVGVVVPDLALRRGPEGEPVYVEVLGFWSRDAVFHRIELAQRGLGARVVFAASARLRVSPELLAGDLPAALYVYKGKMSPRALLAHAERVAPR
jgi:uncharacterized protein